MRNHDLWGVAPGNNPPTLLCSIDPISAVVGGILPALFGGGGSKGSSQAPTPSSPPAQTAPPQAPDSGPKSTLPQKPTFIGGIPTPPAQTGQKTLLGQ
jgi:hypothetical protein